MYVDIVIQEFLDNALYIRGLSQNTVKGYKVKLSFLTRSQAILKVEDITEEKLRSFFLDGRVNRGWKTNTYLGYYKSYRVFIRWCYKSGYLTGENFMESIEKPKQKKSLPKCLKKEDSLRLLEVARNYPYKYRFLRYRNHAIFATFIYAGLRRKELLNLKYGDVDIENLTIFIREGKGGKDRIIPISHTLANSLKAYDMERKRLHKTCPEFFASLNRNMGYTEHGLKHLKEMMQTASRTKFTIHRLRHTFATMMIEGGCDIYSLSRMMGHSDITTTTIYLSTTVEHLRAQIMKHSLN